MSGERPSLEENLRSFDERLARAELARRRWRLLAWMAWTLVGGWIGVALWRQ